MNLAIFLISFFSIQRVGSKSFTSPAMRQLKAVASSCVIGPMPLRPSMTARQFSSVFDPTDESRPIPVTTTLRDKSGAPFRCVGKLLLRLAFDVRDGVFYSGDLFGVLIGDVDIERFFEGH